MAASIGKKVCTSLLRSSCYNPFRHKVYITNIHRLNFKNIYTSCLLFTDDTDHSGKSEEFDLDFFGIEELEDSTYITEPIDPIRSERLGNVDAALYTKMALQRSNPQKTNNEERLPFGKITFDKKVVKGFSAVDNRKDNELKERESAFLRHKIKENKKLQKKLHMKTLTDTSWLLNHKEKTRDDKYLNTEDRVSFGKRMCVTKSDEYISYAHEVDKVFEGHDNLSIPVGESNLLDHINIEQDDEVEAIDPDMSYLDQAYFGSNQLNKSNSDDRQTNDVSLNMGFIDEQYFDGFSKSVQIRSVSQTPKNMRYIQMYDKHESEMPDADEKLKPDFRGDGDVNAKTQMNDMSEEMSEYNLEPLKHGDTTDERNLIFDTFSQTSASQTLSQPGDEFQQNAKTETLIKENDIKKMKRDDKCSKRNQIGSVGQDIPLQNSSYVSKLNRDNELSDLDKILSFQQVSSFSELGNRRNRYASKRKFDNFESSAYKTSKQLRNEFESKEGLNIYGRANPKVTDSKGFRILTKQTPDFKNVPKVDILRVLRQNVLFNSHDVVAINKPYGIPLQGGMEESLCIDNFLSDIIPTTTLYSIDTMETDVSGVMLFGKTEEMRDILVTKFQNGQICRKFLTITKNIPNPLYGEIDIPVIEGTVQGKHRMALRPHRSPDLAAIMPKRKPGRDAVTRYRMLDSKDNNYALLECISLTAVKHQIRVHLAFGLNCPILGDHKYSHLDKFAPMNLHPNMLERLKIQQSKVRHLALHLHCRSVVVPNFLNGRNLFVSAPLPVHFMANMRDLKLKLPPNC